MWKCLSDLILMAESCLVNEYVVDGQGCNYQKNAGPQPFGNKLALQRGDKGDLYRPGAVPLYLLPTLDKTIFLSYNTCNDAQ
jgi:hypothetical protein